jgi:alanine-glyoxylate transaminase/serine-glyoxylate transaminase/serine-pyruvate transaminase
MVRSAQGWPLLGHLDPAFLPLLESVQERLRHLFGTDNAFTLPLAGTGTSGMEAVVGNLIEAGDRVVVGVHGVFGQRFAEAARGRGADTIEVRTEFGAVPDPAAIVQALAAGPVRLCCVVHAETSTGVLLDLEPVAAAVRTAGALFAVDAVTSLGGMGWEADELGIDAAFSGTQKCLSAPPGLSPLTLSPAALRRVAARRSPPPFAVDAGLLMGYFGPDRAYHHTAPVSLIYALSAALDEVFDEGMDARERRHRAVAAQLRRGLEAMDLAPLVAAAHATPMLTSVLYPDGVEDRAFRAHLRNVHAIEIGGGLGPLAGRVFRLGLMGHGARTENVMRVLAAIGDALAAQGHVVDLTAALEAAMAG